VSNELKEACVAAENNAPVEVNLHGAPSLR
jgi:hypothetical protein